MINVVFDNFLLVMQRGGWVMWPLLVLMVTAGTLVMERLFFWIRTNQPRRMSRFEEIVRLLRHGQRESARVLAVEDHSVYGRAAMRLVDRRADLAAAADATESQRPRLERFMSTLSTVITAAPLLGILGTVTGLIKSFNILAKDQSVRDLGAVSGAIGEALLTTAVGLGVSIVVLFPYNAFRAQIDRTLSRFEVLIAAASRAHGDDPS